MRLANHRWPQYQLAGQPVFGANHSMRTSVAPLPHHAHQGYSRFRVAGTPLLATQGQSIERVAGMLSALFLYVGRWHLGRIFPWVPDNLITLLEPRLWIVFLLFLLMGMHAVGPTKALLPHYVVSRHAERNNLFLFLFLLYMSLSSVWSPDIPSAIEKTYELALIGVSVLAIIRITRLSDGEVFQRYFWGTIIVVGSALVLLALMTASTTRISVLAGGPNTFGRLMGFLALGSFGLILSAGNAEKSKKIVNAVLLASGTAALLLVALSGSRGALLSTIVSFSILIYLSRIKKQQLILISVVSFLLVFTVLEYTAFGSAVEMMFERRVVRLLIQERYTSGRDTLYREAIAIGLRHPIAGAGLASFGALTGEVYPHNMLLEAFSEGGSIALILIVIWLAGWTRFIIRHRKSIHPTTIAAAVFALGFSQTSGDFFDNRTVFVLVTLSQIVICPPKNCTSWSETIAYNGARRIVPWQAKARAT